jgi:hypothetical protein
MRPTAGRSRGALLAGEEPVAAGTVPRTPIDYRDDPAVNSVAGLWRRV